MKVPHFWNDAHVSMLVVKRVIHMSTDTEKKGLMALKNPQKRHMFNQIDDLLKRHGLVIRTKQKRSVAPYT